MVIARRKALYIIERIDQRVIGARQGKKEGGDSASERILTDTCVCLCVYDIMCVWVFLGV